MTRRAPAGQPYMPRPLSVAVKVPPRTVR